MRRQRVHQPYEIGGAPNAPHGRHRRQRGLDLAPCHGGRSHTAAPCTGPAPPKPGTRPRARPGSRPGLRLASPPGFPSGGRGASMSPPAPIAVRSSGSVPHSSHCRIPGSSSAPPAATSSRSRSPRAATGEPGARRRSAARPASAGTSRTSKRSPTESRTGSPGTVAQPSSFSYQPRIRSAGSSGSNGCRGRGIVRIAEAAEQAAGGTEPTMPSATVEKARELRWVFPWIRCVSTKGAGGCVGRRKVVRP